MEWEFFFTVNFRINLRKINTFMYTGKGIWVTKNDYDHLNWEFNLYNLKNLRNSLIYVYEASLYFCHI